jgi:hypothetical protein
MTKNIREVFGQPEAGDQQIGAVEAVKEGIQAVAPGLSLRAIFSDLKAEMTEQLAHGAHELAAALFNGSPFVMYGRGGHDQEPQNGSPEVQQQERDRGEIQQQERDRGGREM